MSGFSSRLVYALAVFFVVGSVAPGWAQPTTIFSDDFERPDGLIDGWSVFLGGDWNLSDGRVVTGPTAGEHWLWPDPAVVVPATARNIEIDFEMEFLSPGSNATVGRHGGIAFACTDPTERYAAGFTGYFVDWIDRTTGENDRGIRLWRVDDGTHVPLAVGQGDPVAEPPLEWSVEMDDTHIRVYGDGVEIVNVEDGTYRSGHFGLWTWAGDQEVAYDNFEVRAEVPEVAACFTVTPETPLQGTDMFFDAGCSIPVDEIVSYSWDFGDGNTAMGLVVEHTYEFADIYTVTLTVEHAGGQTASTSRQVSVVGLVGEFSDDFDRPDGAIDGWTVFSGDWRLAGNRLATGPTSTEEWIWAGSPPVMGPGNAVYEFEMSFLSPGTNADVGRHAGFQFSCSAPTQRGGAGAFTGYFIDWIDRTTDRGIRMHRVDEDGTHVALSTGQGDPKAEPPLEWRVEVDGDNIRVFGDGELIVDVVDGTHRGGFFGFWSYLLGQEVEYDNFNMTSNALTPCFTTMPESGIVAGTDVRFDASCSSVFGGGAEIVSYSWDFGDGVSAMGLAVEHTYQFADTYTVSLTVEDDGGNSATLDRTIVVSEPLVPFADCFDRPDGPLDGWTIHAGDWNIVDGALVAGPAAGGGQAGEQQAFAGDPPGLLPTGANYVISFDWEYLAPEDSQPVGRHAGCFFEFNQPGIRWNASTSGYQLWWIDRESDRGFSLARWDGAGLNVLQAGTFELFPNPPANVRIEVTGDQIQVYGDDVLAIDVTDGTYRGGIFGLWTWDGAGNHVRFDNVQIGVDELPPCGDLPGKMFVRGDTNTDGGINIADPVFLLNNLFGGGPASTCTEATDINDDGGVNIADPVYLLNRLFGGGPPVPPPNPSCGEDPNNLMPVFDCASFPPCEA